MTTDIDVNSTTPITTLIKTLCDESKTIKIYLCKVLSKSKFDEIVVTDMCGSGNSKVKKDYLSKKLLELLKSIEDIDESLSPVFNCDKLSDSLNNIYDTNYTPADITLQLAASSHIADAVDKAMRQHTTDIEKQLSDLHGVIAKLTARPLSSSEALRHAVEPPVTPTATGPVSHSLKHIDDEADNFITADVSRKLLDFFSKEEFNTEGNRGVTTYGASYKYMGHKSKPKPLPGCLESLMDHINQTRTGGKYELNSCLVNRYEGPSPHCHHMVTMSIL